MAEGETLLGVGAGRRPNYPIPEAGSRPCSFIGMDVIPIRGQPQISSEKSMALSREIRSLGDLSLGDEADLFLLLVAKESGTTRTNQPFWLLKFRDGSEEIEVAIWANSPWYETCEKEWKIGDFFKVRASLRQSRWGPTLDIRKIRHIRESDYEEGFDPTKYVPESPVPKEELYAKLMTLLAERMSPSPLRDMTEKILKDERQPLLTLPGSRTHHHTYPGGWLEHTLSVAEICVFLAEKYVQQYPELRPPIDRELVLAGGVLHDIGKLRELVSSPLQAVYSPDGALIGHVVLGRDIIREAASEVGFSGERLLKLEHIIVSHQDWPGSGVSKPTMFSEALLVRYADVIDTKFAIMRQIFEEGGQDGPLTSDRNLLRHALFRGSADAAE